MAVFETSLTLDVPADVAFDFLIRPANHEKISPPGVGLRFIDPPEEFSLGTELHFKIQAWGIARSVKHKIIEFERPELYVEEQIEGPLKEWVHEHRFEISTQGKLVIIDQITFSPPGGLLGMMATESKILENLEDGFYHRHQQIKKLLKAGP